MFSISILGSGSKANSYLIRGYEDFVIDNGYSFKEFNRRIELLNHKHLNIKNIFLTHTHQDHCKGIPTLSRRFKIPIYLNNLSDLNKLRKNSKCEINPFIYNKPIIINKDFQVLPLETSHDSEGSTCFFFKYYNNNFAVITDTGETNNKMLHLASSCDTIILESNYNLEMLHNSSYPWPTKSRIKSAQGHLSNFQAAEFIKDLLKKTRKKIHNILLCHLSENSNTPEQLIEDYSIYFDKFKNYKFETVIGHGILNNSNNIFFELNNEDKKYYKSINIAYNGKLAHIYVTNRNKTSLFTSNLKNMKTEISH